MKNSNWLFHVTCTMVTPKREVLNIFSPLLVWGRKDNAVVSVPTELHAMKTR